MGEIIWHSGYPRVEGVNWPPIKKAVEFPPRYKALPEIDEGEPAADRRIAPKPEFTIHDLRAGQMTTATSKIIPPIS